MCSWMHDHDMMRIIRYVRWSCRRSPRGNSSQPCTFRGNRHAVSVSCGTLQRFGPECSPWQVYRQATVAWKRNFPSPCAFNLRLVRLGEHAMQSLSLTISCLVVTFFFLIPFYMNFCGLCLILRGFILGCVEEGVGSVLQWFRVLNVEKLAYWWKCVEVSSEIGALFNSVAGYWVFCQVIKKFGERKLL